jgi:high-affinity K+ transport system ATPase subunit B
MRAIPDHRNRLQRPRKTVAGAPRRIRKGAVVEAVCAWVTEQGGIVPGEIDAIAQRIARSGSTPLAVADSSHLLGILVVPVASG